MSDRWCKRSFLAFCSPFSGGSRMNLVTTAHFGFRLSLQWRIRKFFNVNWSRNGNHYLILRIWTIVLDSQDPWLASFLGWKTFIAIGPHTNVQQSNPQATRKWGIFWTLLDITPRKQLELESYLITPCVCFFLYRCFFFSLLSTVQIIAMLLHLHSTLPFLELTNPPSEIIVIMYLILLYTTQSWWTKKKQPEP